MLLTVHVQSRADDAPEPLDLREWNKLARWLHERDLTPEDVLLRDPGALLEEVGEARLDRDRLLRLLERGPALALALDRWESAGIWVRHRSDADFPRRLRERLKASAPALLFGCGDIALGDAGGVAIVGSRNVSPVDRQLAYTLGRMVSAAGKTVVSGGARGTDGQAADGAFEGGGRVVAVVADSLMRNIGRRQYREQVTDGNLLLVTPYSPDAGFTPGNALGRNRLIYCLADTSIAVCSANGTGGTFAGARQNLEKQWVPLWVAQTDAPESGNPALVEAGARWLPPLDRLKVDELFTTANAAPLPDGDGQLM
jgi:predicted Rossmann fold nucleotide-binding protein DprA/Smf involved in DNA uptake